MNYLVVGLGNIGPEYASTRHNMGFMTLDALAKASNVTFESKRFGDMATLRIKGRTLNLLKPSTYMNNSGRAVAHWVTKLKIQPEQLLVVVDDLALPFGALRMRGQGSNGGHNGLRSIDEHLGSNSYARLRLGIGSGFAPGAQVDFVLSEIGPEEQKMLPEVLETASEAIKTFVLEGVGNAMNKFNKKGVGKVQSSAESSSESSSQPK
ncbi:MAG: aminoacyl-tRNA hydrolase [Bacteroidales bacterium]|nr:aminoacyl-tRNA hydrolase [Bacteroidales bacterium]